MRRRGAELLVDAYHALGVVPLTLTAEGLNAAWVVGGGYKYLQLGEGNCFLRLPPQAQAMRPVDHGLVRGVRRPRGQSAVNGVAYGAGAARFAGLDV